MATTERIPAQSAWGGALWRAEPRADGRVLRVRAPRRAAEVLVRRGGIDPAEALGPDLDAAWRRREWPRCNDDLAAPVARWIARGGCQSQIAAFNSFLANMVNDAVRRLRDVLVYVPPDEARGWPARAVVFTLGEATVHRPVFPRGVRATGLRTARPPEVLSQPRDQRLMRGQQAPARPCALDPEEQDALGLPRPLFPSQARRLGVSYTGVTTVSVHAKVIGPAGALLEERTETGVPLGDMPIMVGSTACNLSYVSLNGGLEMAGEDPYQRGGYFVVAGAERVLVDQESAQRNDMFVYRTAITPPEQQASGIPALPGKGQRGLRFVVEMRSCQEDDGKNTNLLSVRTQHCVRNGKQLVRGEQNLVGAGGVYTAILPFLRKEVNLAVLLMALGFVSTDDILRCVTGEAGPPWSDAGRQIVRLFQPTLEDAACVTDQEHALRIIARGAMGTPVEPPSRLVRVSGRASSSAAAVAAARARRRVKDHATEAMATEASGESVVVQPAAQPGGRMSSVASAPIDRLDPRASWQMLRCIAQHLLAMQKPWVDGAGQKALVIGRMTRRLMQAVLGEAQDDDRDGLAHKRQECASDLLGGLFESSIALSRGELQTKVERQLDRVLKRMREDETPRPMETLLDKLPLAGSLISTGPVTRGMIGAVSTGNFPWTGYVSAAGYGVSGAYNATRPGVVQALGNTSFLQALAHTRRVDTAVTTAGKIAKPRMVVPSHFGMVCIPETPEGASCGLVRNRAMGSRVSRTLPALFGSRMRTLLDTLGVRTLRLEPMDDKGGAPLEEVPEPTHRARFDPLSDANAHNLALVASTSGGPPAVQVLVNGALVGVHHDGPALLAELLRRRRRGEIPLEVSFNLAREDRDLVVRTSPGRLMRPLGIVDPETRWVLVRPGDCDWDTAYGADIDDLVRQGKAEWIDAAEMDSLTVAMSVDALRAWISPYTHFELHLLLVLGVTAGSAPFIEHEPAARQCYVTNLRKQSLGCMPFGGSRLDTVLRVATHPQHPLTTTLASRVLGVDQHGSGNRVVVAMMLGRDGQAQNDAIEIKREFLQRGGFGAWVQHTVRGAVEVPQHAIRRPECASHPQNHHRFRHLGDNGVARPGSRIEVGDVVIGRELDPRLVGQDGPRVDASIVARKDDVGVVEEVQMGHRPHLGTFVRVVVGRLLRPRPGDKFTSRHGQKGVCSSLYTERDGPYDSEGVVPDLIFNPYGLAARMTLNMPMEGLHSLAACLYGRLALLGLDATSFSDSTDKHAVRRLLLEGGVAPSARRMMYDGMTGQPIGPAVVVVLHYDQLRHMVEGKMHAREDGPVDPLTRQPTEGRANDGGLRIGEMERDIICANGAAYMLRNRMQNMGDGCRVFLCGRCGNLARAVPHLGEAYCPACEGDKDVFHSVLPFAAVLVMHEHGFMGVNWRMRPKPSRPLLLRDDAGGAAAPEGGPPSYPNPYQICQ